MELKDFDLNLLQEHPALLSIVRGLVIDFLVWSHPTPYKNYYRANVGAYCETEDFINLSNLVNYKP